MKGDRQEDQENLLPPQSKQLEHDLASNPSLNGEPGDHDPSTLVSLAVN